jgi:hypothetical protein
MWSWLSTLPIWAWIFLSIYFLYLIFFFWMFHKLFSKYIPAYRKMSKEDKKKYFMFIRPEVDSNDISPVSMFICGITLAPIRFVIWVITLILTNLFLRMVWCCSDRNKPLSKCRRCLAKFISQVT